MHSIIVVPGVHAGCGGQIRLAPGEALEFGRQVGAEGSGGPRLPFSHGGISRRAGRVRAVGAHWTLTNLSRGRTYAVENPEGAGEHIKVAPGRVEAPIPFEFSRVLLPAGDDVLAFDVWAPCHDYVVPGEDGGGEPTSPAFPLDHGKRYFLVLAALCEPRLRGEFCAPSPTTAEILRRLRPVWPEATAAAVQWNIDYLAVKLRLKPDPRRTAEPGPRLNGKKDSLAALALRFDLVTEDDLSLLGGPGSRR